MRSDHWRNEADWLPSDVDDLVELRRRVIELGQSPSVANGLVGWLLSKAAGEEDRSGPNTRARYRRILAELELVGPEPEGRIAARHLEAVPGSAGGRRKGNGHGVRKTVVALVLVAAGSLGVGTHGNGSISTSGQHSASPGASAADGRAAENPRTEGSVKRRRRRAA